MPIIFAGRTVTLVSEAADGGALPAKFLGIGASDGSLLQALIVESATDPNLRVRLYSGSNALVFFFTSNDGIAAGASAVPTMAHQLEYNGATFDRIRHSFIILATGLTSNGAGSTLALGTTPTSKFSIQIERTVGASAFTVALEGSLGAGTFTELGRDTFDAGAGMFFVVNTPVTQLRYNIISVGAGNTLAIRIMGSGR